MFFSGFSSSSSRFLNWCLLRHGVPVRPRNGSVLRSLSDGAAVERLVSGVFQRDSSRCFEFSPRALNLYRSTLGEQRFSGNDAVVVVFVVHVCSTGEDCIYLVLTSVRTSKIAYIWC